MDMGYGSVVMFFKTGGILASLNIDSMRQYLSRSISSLNQNKLNGMLAEIDLRSHLATLGFDNRISIGGWIMRTVGENIFSNRVVVLFPEIIQPGIDYSQERTLPNPTHGLHTICSTFHQIGIHSYFCTPIVHQLNDSFSVTWKSVQLGLPEQRPYEDFPRSITDFSQRIRNYNFLRYRTETVQIPEISIPEEYSKENLRVCFNSAFMAEVSDVDGILWGRQFTYPIEIKEKTAAFDKNLGEYFGLDVGPFVKLAFYASKRGNLHSIFIVREINNTEERHLINWWFITFDALAQYASWVPISGGKNMRGGGSMVIKVPKNQFKTLNSRALEAL